MEIKYIKLINKTFELISDFDEKTIEKAHSQIEKKEYSTQDFIKNNIFCQKFQIKF